MKDDQVLLLEEGKPLIFGSDRKRGIRLNGLDPEIVDLGEDVSEEDKKAFADAMAAAMKECM